jgi:two-component system chemotaxis sensor kinase CheA
MVPIKSTFQKMIRLVRDLSKKSGKNVALEMRGEETEIDRNMVEEIYEPLVHMIRNSVDHGIEAPGERTNAGKRPQGTVFLSAEQKGGNILIHIQDDGRGLNVEKIRARAVERGIISNHEILEEREIYELIFHPGFSTNEQVTEVSGRGVGMDVVKRSVERLRGKIEISSSQGRGTQFNLKLPLTMAIIDGMIVRVGEERFVVPTIALNESLRPSKDAYVTVQGKGELIRVREKLMPLIRLHEIFEVPPRCYDPWKGLLLVVNEDNRSYCLLADEIIGRQEVVIKSLGSTLRLLGGISGGAILGDGKVALIVDVKGIVSLYEDSGK